MVFTSEDYKAANIIARSREDIEAELEAVRERFDEANELLYEAEVDDDPMMAFAHGSDMGMLQVQAMMLSRALEAKDWGDKISSGEANFQDLIQHIFG